MCPATIGPFQVLRELGRGGMGEVYLARDTRLDREVAIKALPAHLATDPDRLARFQREAKVLASLNHPGIGAIYGLEEAAGHQYLVLEYVEGETLADQLARGPIPVDEALALAKQISEALEVAHEKGVVHRDLKPANVMITPDGAVKVLDFGLARTADGNPSSAYAAAAADSPTLNSPHSPTTPGAIMGTAGYMSPEQARGKPVDKRSDIFSFGCVLYEMLTGAQPFSGETVTDSLGAILHRDPNWTLLPPRTPPRIRELLGTCLAKDRRQRLHDMGDARLELERAIAGREWTSVAHQARPHRTLMLAAMTALTAAVFLACGWLLASRFTPPAVPTQSFHVSTTVPAKPVFTSLIGISPDARFVVYRAWQELAADSVKPPGILVVRRLDRDETKIIEGTEGVMEASLSPDGRWLAFSAAKDIAATGINLKKIALENGQPSGAPETLCALPQGGSPMLCWSSDREIVLALTWEPTILAVSAAGGEPRVVLKEERSKDIDNWGDVRPLVHGKSILATRWALVGQTIKERTEIIDIVSGKRTPLLQNAGVMQYLPGGYVVARRNVNSLIAARFDLSTLQIVGEPVTVLSGKAVGNFFVSDNGTLAMMTEPGDISSRRLAWIDEQGLPAPLPAPPRAYGEITISPDGGRIAMSQDWQFQAELVSDLWVHDLTRRMLTRVPTQGPSWVFVWSNDGLWITHSTVSQDEFAVWDRRSDGSGEPVKLYSGPTSVMVVPTAWSPDGNVLAILQQDMTSNSEDVLMLEQEAGGTTWKATPYLNSPANEHALQFSSDGKWVLFCSVESGRHELYVQRFTGAANGAEDARAGRVQISTNGHDGMGWWSPDGKEIRYIDGDKQVMSVAVQTEPTFSASLPKVLYSIKDLKTRSRAFARDGRLMVVLQGDDEQILKIDLVVNFFEELRAKLAAAK